MSKIAVAIHVLTSLFFCGCALVPDDAIAAAKITVTSPSFKEGGMIPEKHAYDKDNISPAIEWSSLPEGTQAIAVICDDPDAPSGNWVHWVVFNIPPAAGGLPEGVPMAEALDDGSLQGANDFKKIGYDGPYPPYGTHRYIFRVYAVDTMLDLPAGVTRAELMNAIKGRILGAGSLTGRYKRKIDTPKHDMLE